MAKANGCASAPLGKTFSIKKVIIFAGRDTAVAKGQPLQLQATGASTYTWTPAACVNSNSIYNPVAVLYNNEQTYYVKGITTEGCLGFDTINIKVFNKADIYMPNAFTPNGDGVNDYLQPAFIGIKQLKFFRIYDRWGNTVFTARSQYDKWDARLNGQKLETGAYVWVAEAIMFGGTVIQRRGSVMLIK